MIKNFNKIDPVIGSQPKAWTLWGATLGLLLIGVGTIIPLISGPAYYYGPDTRTPGYDEVFRWIYGAGALMLLVARIFAPYKGESTRIKRLFRIESWSALFFCVATFFIFYQPAVMRDWLAFTMAGGAVQVYSSIMIPLTVKKEIKKREKRD